MQRVKQFVASLHVRKNSRRMNSQPFMVPASLRNPRKVLICLPGGLRELTLIKSFLPTIADLFASADITLLPLPGSVVSDIFPRKGFNIETPTVDRITWSGLPSKDFLKRLANDRYDLVIDLNLERSNFTSAVLLNFPNAIRVGRGNHLGAPYYNLEIKSKYLRDEKNIYRSLFDTIAVFIQPPPDQLTSHSA